MHHFVQASRYMIYSTRGPIQYKDTVLPVYKSHCGDKIAITLSYLHNGISYTGKTASLYWIRVLKLVLPAPAYVLAPDSQTCFLDYCPACRTTFIATRFRVAVICPIIQVPHCIRVFFYFVWFVFINHIFQFHYELCTYCNILDIYLS